MYTENIDWKKKKKESLIENCVPPTADIFVKILPPNIYRQTQSEK